MGGVFFHEFDNLDALNLLLFPISIVVTLFGVAILAYNMGAVYNRVLTKLHLKQEEILPPEMRAKEQWQHHRGIATHSVWGGIAFLGTEYYQKQNTRMIEPHAVRNFKTRRRLDLGVEMANEIENLKQVDGADTEKHEGTDNHLLKEAQAEIEQLKAKLQEKEQRIRTLEEDLAARIVPKMDGMHDDSGGLVGSFQE